MNRGVGSGVSVVATVGVCVGVPGSTVTGGGVTGGGVTGVGVETGAGVMAPSGLPETSNTSKFANAST